jgi:hypothetical protein
MTEAEELPVLSTSEALALREKWWSRRLETVSLAAEYSVDPAHVAQMLEVLGRLYRKYAADSYHRHRFLRRHPAVHVLATTYAATERYDSHGFWPKLAELLQVPNNQPFQAEWGEAFLDNLRTLRLTTFANADADAGTRFLGRILLHCGVPTACLGDYYRVVTEQRRREPGTDAESFVTWARARAETGRLVNVDMPVNRFLRFGGEFAVDVTDRVFELLDIVGAGGDGTDVPLPERFRVQALELHRAGRLERVSSRGGQDVRVHPHLGLDPYGGGPLLHLPPVGDAPDGSATWVVTLGGDPQRVRTSALWPGSAEPAPATSVPVPRPIRVASAALEGREHLLANVSVVDDTDPFLAFGEDGVLVPPGLALPGAATWLLVPGPASDLLFQGVHHVLSQATLPPGWSQWSLTRVDLTEVQSVQFGEDGRPHTVRSFSTARIEAGMPLDGVRTSSGAPVFPRVPEVVLPAALGSDVEWDVSLLDARRAVVARRTVRADDAVDLWASLERPLLGSFTVRVRGPWGRGASRTLFLAEGLAVRSQPRWRRLTPAGLVPATVTIEPAVGMTCDVPVLGLKPPERQGHVTLSAHGTAAMLQLSPPHMTISYQSTETTTGPSVRAHQLYTEDVRADPGTLILDLGADAQPILTVLSGPEAVQILEPGAGRQGVYRFSLAQLVDTLGMHRYLTMSLGDEGQLPVASIRPKRLFSSVTLESSQLAFADCADIPGLVALVYATRAPWRPAVSVPINAGCAELPEELVGAGPLLVSARVEDPWVPEPVPAWPDPGRAAFVHADGWLSSGDPEEAGVSAFLAGVRDLPEHIDDYTRLWTVRGHLSSLALEERRNGVSEEVKSALLRRPQEALQAMAESRVSTDEIPALLVRTKLAWADLIEAHDDTPPQWSLRGALPAALLSAADAHWSADEVDAAVAVCGDVVAGILQGQDPFASAGRFDAGAEIFAGDPRLREAIVASMGLVPQGLLGKDTRVMAAMELIARRQDGRLKQLVREAHQLMAGLERLLAAVAGPAVQAAFRARLHPSAEGGWRVLPAVSLGLALAARHAARGDARAAAYVERQRQTWTELALVVPQLVTIDLILAELLVAGDLSRTEEQGA